MIKTMKKFMSMLLVFTLMIGTLCTPAFASSATSTEPLNGFYVKTEDVPEEAIEYAQNSIGGMISDLYALNTVTLGKPFKLSGANLYYFIIYSNKEIVGTYRVYNTDNGYTGIFNESDEIISGLQKLKELTSPDNPAKIILGDFEDILAVIGSDVYTVLEDYAGNVTDETRLLIEPASLDELSVVDVSEGIEFRVSVIFTTPSYKFLQIGWAETQGSLPWCMAYVTASIMRYKTGYSISTISARKVMEYCYPNLSKEELEAKSLSTTKAAEFANRYKVYPTYTRSRRTYSQVTSQIKADNPLDFICDNLTKGTKRSHALVCRGYNDNNGNSFYSIWNPWYTKFERMYTSNNIYTTPGGTKYLWSATMYGWD